MAAPCKPVGLITNTVGYTLLCIAYSKGVCMLNIRLLFVNRLEQVFKTYIQSHQEKIIGDSATSKV